MPPGMIRHLFSILIMPHTDIASQPTLSLKHLVNDAFTLEEHMAKSMLVY